MAVDIEMVLIVIGVGVISVALLIGLIAYVFHTANENTLKALQDMNVSKNIFAKAENVHEALFWDNARKQPQPKDETPTTPPEPKMPLELHTADATYKVKKENGRIILKDSKTGDRYEV